MLCILLLYIYVSWAASVVLFAYCYDPPLWMDPRSESLSVSVCVCGGGGGRRIQCFDAHKRFETSSKLFQIEDFF